MIEKYADLYRGGSREICDPPPLDTDEDWLVVVRDPDDHQLVKAILRKDGFDCSLTDGYPSSPRFTSWRKGQLNYVVTADHDFAWRWRVATALAKRLNLLDKGDRIALFQAVVFAEHPDGIPATTF